MLNTFTTEQLWQGNRSCRKLKKQLQAAIYIFKVILLMVCTGMILSNMLTCNKKALTETWKTIILDF